MPVSILGEHISLVRPSAVRKCFVYRSERVTPRQGSRCKTNKSASGKVKAIVVELTNGQIFGLERGTHIQVCEAHDISTHYVARTGWLLENGNYVWR